MSKLVKAEYEGVAVSFQDDGWFNATQVAAKHGKRVDNWLRSQETQDYVGALSNALNTSDVRDLVKTKRGKDGGTWLHPKLAVRFAQWIDVRFAVWCDMQIDAILHENKAEQIDESEPSTVLERTPLYLDVVQAVIRHRLMFPVVYQGINDVAGSDAFCYMTKKQVRIAKPFARRIANGTATSEDWKILDARRKALGRDQIQPELNGFGPPALK
jgi:hypothetical protein